MRARFLLKYWQRRFNTFFLAAFNSRSLPKRRSARITVSTLPSRICVTRWRTKGSTSLPLSPYSSLAACHSRGVTCNKSKISTRPSSHILSAGLPQRFLAITNADRGTLQQRITLREFPPQPSEHLVDAALGLGAVVGQASPNTLVARLGAWRRLIILIAKQRGHHVGDRALVGVHGVHRTHGGHPLLVGALTRRPLPAAHRRRALTANDDPLAVRRHHHDLPFFGRGRRALGLPKPTDVLSHLPITAFEAIHGLLQLQHACDGLVHLAKGLLHGQRLIPILQHVGKGTGGQLQAIVQRHELQRLPFAAAVHRSL